MKAAVIKTEPGVNTLVVTEPRTEAHLSARRNVDLVWDAGPGVDRFDREVTEVAVLSCFSFHPDRKRYVATLRRHQEGDGMRSCLIQVGTPAPFEYHEDALRYSRNGFLEFIGRAHAALVEHAQDPDVCEVFGVEPTTVVEVVTKPTHESTLEWLQRQVGGDIEPVTLDPARMEGYVNETGLLDGLPRNEVATQFWFAQLGGEFMVLPGAYLAGPLVVVGPLDGDGNTTTVTDDVIAEIEAFVDRPVETNRMAKEAASYLADATP